MEKLIRFISHYIYGIVRKIVKGHEIQKKRNMLASLYPGKNSEQLLEEYYLKKIGTIIIATIAGIVLTLMVFLEQKMNPIVDEQGRIERADYGKLDYTTDLVAEVENKDIKINIDVKERKYTRDQIDTLSEEIYGYLEIAILGENDSLSHITTDIKLVDEVENYPFMLRWESSDYEVMNDNGELLKREINPDGEPLEMTVYMTYEEITLQRVFGITIFPKEKTEEERTEDEIIASIQKKQEETINEKYLQLPMSVGNKGISWKMSSGNSVIIMAIMSVVALIGIWWGVDNDLAKKYRKRDQLLRLDYSEFVSKLQLLISSGMTLRGALERMEADYKLYLKDGGKEKYVYEELNICLKRLRDGASETDVYMMFGNRSGLMSYKKLMTLLVQNLRKGTKGLVEALNFEAKVAFEERKQLARRLGDEAQTKLLFPMVMMLGVVMIIIIVPAYYSFGI